MLRDKMRFSRLLGFFLILNLLSENLGYFRRGLDVFPGVLLAVIIAGCYLAEYRAGNPDRPLGYLLLKSSLLLLSLAFIIKAGSLRVLGLPFFVFSLWLDFERDERAAREFSVVLVSLAFYAAFFFCGQNFPAVSRLVAGFSFFLSGLLSRLARDRVELGPAVFGIFLLAAAVFFHLSLWLLGGRKRRGDFAANFLFTVFGPFLSLLLYLLIYLDLIEPISMKKIQLPAPVDFSTVFSYLYPNSIQFLLLLILVPGMYFHYRLARDNISAVSLKAGRLQHQLLAGAAVFIIFFPFMFPLASRLQGRQVHIFDRDYLDLKRPGSGAPDDPRKSGMFGRLPGFLRARGYAVTTGEVYRATLAESDVLVVINLPEKFSSGEKKIIWDFVRGGGGLLVLGDHTGMKGIREPFNELLEPVNIEFNFDSAKPFVEGWQEALRLFPHPVTRGLGTGFTESQIWIGASLEARPPGRPVIVGTYGFADAGNPDNQDGFLGDLLYSPGERLGDVVLVAEARMGKGKILVFGDTSSFQNLALVSSHRFVERVFRWLAEGEEKSLWYLSVIGMAAVVMLICLKKVRTDGSLILICSLALILSGTMAGLPEFPGGSAGPVKEKVAWIDASHCEQFSFRVWGDNAVGGLSLNLMRNGYSPLLLEKFDRRRIAAAGALVLISPLRGFSRSEIDFLETFVRDGGRLIVSVGRDESVPPAPLLERFAFRIGGVPLGSLPPEKTSAGIHLACGWNVECGAEDAEILCAAWDYPVITARRYGRGRITVIGDSRFLLNKNLEDRDEYKEENILFFKELLTR